MLFGLKDTARVRFTLCLYKTIVVYVLLYTGRVAGASVIVPKD